MTVICLVDEFYHGTQGTRVNRVFPYVYFKIIKNSINDIVDFLEQKAHI
jgi:hypothetical protein